MLMINNKFDIGDIVYLKTDRDQCERIVVGICQNANSVMYEVKKETTNAWHYEFEMTLEKNVAMATSG